ncbi:hypothetical protein QFZ55_000069 [Streptomyces luteogriseus]|nr:hypothetical protein [Streptomyces luteogriseus]
MMRTPSLEEPATGCPGESMWGALATGWSRRTHSVHAVEKMRGNMTLVVHFSVNVEFNIHVCDPCVVLAR